MEPILFEAAEKDLVTATLKKKRNEMLKCYKVINIRLHCYFPFFFLSHN